MNLDLQPARSYGGLGIVVLRTLAEQGRPTFTMAEAREAARASGIEDSYLPLLLHRLQRAGWVRRLKRGTYALAAGLPGLPEAHPFAVAMALVEPCAISGWAALNHRGLTEQVPGVITLTTPKHIVTPAMRGTVRAAPSTWEAAGQPFEIVTVIPARFFGDEDVWIGDVRVRMFDRERALLDCFVAPRRFGGLAEGLGVLEEHRRGLDIARLVAYARRYGIAAVAKRVGWALEHAGVAPEFIEPLQELPMAGYRPLDPDRARIGRRNARWQLVENMAAGRRQS